LRDRAGKFAPGIVELQENVGGFDIAMENPPAVSVVHRIGEVGN
jgi:hypothetical protein